MNAALKAVILEQGGKVLGNIIRIAMTSSTTTTTKESMAVVKPVSSTSFPSSRLALPTSEETTTELKRRLAKELYRAELDLAAGLKIADRPCDCLSNKHTLMLEAATEELISQDPGNSTVYQNIIAWIPKNAHKVSPEAIQSGKYADEYPGMANEFKNFRKRVMGSVAQSDSPVVTVTPKGTKEAGQITLEEAKRLASDEAAKEVERQWNKE